jgi:hypothetical protein
MYFLKNMHHSLQIPISHSDAFCRVLVELVHHLPLLLCLLQFYYNCSLLSSVVGLLLSATSLFPSVAQLLACSFLFPLLFVPPSLCYHPFPAHNNFSNGMPKLVQ